MPQAESKSRCDARASQRLLLSACGIADHVGPLRRRELERVSRKLRVASPSGKRDFGAVAERVLEYHPTRTRRVESDFGIFELRILAARNQPQPLEAVAGARVGGLE